MRATVLRWALLFLLGGAVLHLPAQPSEANRKLLADLRAKAETGDAVAQLYLGLCYQGGLSVAKDFVEAAKWFCRAAEQGNPIAQTTLGVMYFEGDGVSKDMAEAAKWFRKAAERGHVQAQCMLGLSYDVGMGLPIDDREALKWYRKAAEQGQAQAQVGLGRMLFSGRGGLTNRTEAVEWFRKAAEQGDAEGQNRLGLSLLNGEGVQQDSEEGVRWCRKAAEQGCTEAQAFLGISYSLGKGVAQDFVNGYRWLALAAASGNTNAASARDTLLGLMTPDQIGEAQRLARDFKPRRAPESGSSISIKAISDSRPIGSGTGFFLTEDGFLVTNEHVVKDAAEVRLVTSAGLIAAKLVKVDAANDLVLLKAEGRSAPLPIASSRAVKLGSTAATVGFPNIGLQGFAPKLAKGEIAALSGAQDDPRYFQISVPVQPGNSGGALVDEHGNVVGVVAAKLNVAAAVATSGALPENVNYAVKSSFLLSFLESVPEVAAKLKEPSTKDRKFEDVVKSAEQAAVLVLVY